MKRKRNFKTPFRHIVILEVLYSVLVGVILYSFNGSDFINISFMLMIIMSIAIGSIATYIHARGL